MVGGVNIAKSEEDAISESNGPTIAAMIMCEVYTLAFTWYEGGVASARSFCGISLSLRFPTLNVNIATIHLLLLGHTSYPL